MTTTPEPIRNVREVAHYMGCDEGLIYKLINERKLRAIRVGRLLRVPQSAIDDFVAGR